MKQSLESKLLTKIRTILDYPKIGVAFKDITPLLSDPELMFEVISKMANDLERLHPTVIIGVEARGFILGAQLAQALHLPFVPVRRIGKLPHTTISEVYDLEYGTNSLEIHIDAISSFDRAIIVDDVLATGGTARAAAKLVHRLNGDVVSFAFLMDVEALNGKTYLLREFKSLIQLYSILTV